MNAYKSAKAKVEALIASMKAENETPPAVFEPTLIKNKDSKYASVSGSTKYDGTATALTNIPLLKPVFTGNIPVDNSVDIEIVPGMRNPVLAPYPNPEAYAVASVSGDPRPGTDDIALLKEKLYSSKMSKVEMKALEALVKANATEEIAVPFDLEPSLYVEMALEHFGQEALIALFGDDELPPTKAPVRGNPAKWVPGVGQSPVKKMKEKGKRHMKNTQVYMADPEEIKSLQTLRGYHNNFNYLLTVRSFHCGGKAGSIGSSGVATGSDFIPEVIPTAEDRAKEAEILASIPRCPICSDVVNGNACFNC